MSGTREAIDNAFALVERDREAGVAAMRVLAETGHPDAVSYLAMWLSEATPSSDEAVIWSERAAALGFEIAAWNLAMIANERSRPDDVGRWIDEAERLGSEDAALVRRHGYDVEAILQMWRDQT